MNKEEIIKEVISILETSDYVDPAEDLYDGLKQIKRKITYATVHDFLWALESSTVIDVDGKVAECAKKIKPLLADMTIDEAYK
jgi:Fe2+ or Zn2+ uptake regulation protein